MKTDNDMLYKNEIGLGLSWYMHEKIYYIQLIYFSCKLGDEKNIEKIELMTV